MGKLMRILVWTVFALTCAVSITALIAYRAWRHEPEFYVAALQTPVAEYEEAGDQLEKQVLDLRNDLRKEGLWRAVFTEAQINGWLAADLPDKFPDMLPTTVKDPRVAISSKGLKIAFRYDDGGVATVLSMTLDVHLTDEPNVVAVRIRKARAGSIPLPLNRLIDQVTNAAKHSELELQWAQEGGDPVALIRVPVEHESYEQKELRLESLELRNGEIEVSGKSGREVAAAFFSGSSLAGHFSEPAAEVASAKVSVQTTSSTRRSKKTP